MEGGATRRAGLQGGGVTRKAVCGAQPKGHVLLAAPSL